MNADNLALRGCLQAKRIVVAQVLLRGEGQLMDVFNGLDVVRADVQLLKFVAVERHIVIDILHDFVKPFTLKSAHFVAAHAFFVRIPNHFIA